MITSLIAITALGLPGQQAKITPLLDAKALLGKTQKQATAILTKRLGKAPSWLNSEDDNGTPYFIFLVYKHTEDLATGYKVFDSRPGGPAVQQVQIGVKARRAVQWVRLSVFGQLEWKSVLPLLGLDAANVTAVPRGKHGVELRGVKGLPKGTVVTYVADPNDHMLQKPVSTLTIGNVPLI
ncbi:MAG: hypothetical protein IT363_08555 [Methanoregulaceae archaeon]|nr:hypothetical protein [Methanoregulaceae archaeon]